MAAALILGVAPALPAPWSGGLSAQEVTYRACRVPGVGAIYMIGLEGLPSECLSTEHVEFSWTEGGAPADGSVTTSSLADGAVTTAKLANGAVDSTKVVNRGIAGVDIALESLIADHHATGSVDERVIGNNAVNTAEVVDESLTAFDLAPNSVATSELGYEITSAPATRSTNEITGVATCPGGKIAVNGGHVGGTLASSSATDAFVFANHPTVSNSLSGWRVSIWDPSPAGLQSMTVYAICINE